MPGDTVTEQKAPDNRGRLRRELTLLALVATAVCTVIGGGINVLTVEIQQKIPGIAGMVPWAFALGVVPAVFAALCYGVISSAMPRAGGDYVYISRGLHPFVGFIATVSKWFALAAACGVIAYMDVALLKAAAMYADLSGVAAWLETPTATLLLPLAMIWLFWFLNIIGVREYGWTVIVLMVLMLIGGLVVIAYGFLTSPEVGRQMIMAGDWELTESAPPPGGFAELISAVSVLFFAYIGFASVSQAGGECRNPSQLLPKAFLLSMTIICGYYVLFSAAVYHAIPWELTARIAPGTDLSVPEIMGAIMPQSLAVFVALMAAVALANDLPPMLMSISRLFFAWSEDGIFPRSMAAVNSRFSTPHWALTASAIAASIIAIGCNLHGFFKGIDLVVIGLCFTYGLVAVSVITLPRRNRRLYETITFMRNRTAQVIVSVIAVLTIGVLLYSQIVADLQGMVDRLAAATQGDGTVVMAVLSSNVVLWFIVMAVGAAIFAYLWNARKQAGENPNEVFMTLPAESEQCDPLQ
ncbi:MAG: APC family permease [Armatimonadota bacterium]